MNIIFKEDTNITQHSFDESFNKQAMVKINSDPLFNIICGCLRTHNGILVSLVE